MRRFARCQTPVLAFIRRLQQSTYSATLINYLFTYIKQLPYTASNKAGAFPFVDDEGLGASPT